MTAPILPYAQAAVLVAQQGQLLAAARPPAVERLPLLTALDRVLAAAILSDRHQPPFDRSTRDGYAVKAAALSTGEWLPVVGTLRAGWSASTLSVQAGTALEIMTGAPVARGADAVVMLEHVEHADGHIRLASQRKLHTGDNIVLAGSEARKGDRLVADGTRLSPAHIAVAAAAGAATVEVYVQPRVAILATGDELVELDASPFDHQIRNSNSYTLAAQVLRVGGLPQRLAIARDNLDHLRQALEQAISSSDMLLLSGGVSAGKYDLVEQALAILGAMFHFTGVKIQPGKPAVFGTLPRQQQDQPPLPFFGLPGNPVSTMVTFLLFAAPMLRALAGESAVRPRFAQARLAHPEAAATGITRFLPAELIADWNDAKVRRIPWQGSGDMAATALSNCFVVLPPDTALDAGASVQVLLP